MVVLTFESVDKILWCDHSNETLTAVLFYGTFCFVGLEKVKFMIFLKFLLWPPLGVKGLNILILPQHQCDCGLHLHQLCSSIPNASKFQTGKKHK